MSDITISVIQPPSTTINVGVDETLIIGAGISFPTHSVTHISGGSDEINHNLLGSLQGGSGNQYYHLNSGQYFNLVTGEIVRPGETGQFYPNSNPSGFITGVDLSNYATIDYTTGISGDLQNQINSLNNETGDYVLKTETGDFITNSQTGEFYPNFNPSGFITGVDLSSYATQNYVTGVSGHLQGQITTLNSQSGSFYPRANPSGYITGINNLVFTTGNQTISGGLNVIGTGAIHDTALNISGTLSVNNSYFDGALWQPNQLDSYVAIANFDAVNYIEVSDLGVTLEALTKSFQVYAPTRMHYALTGTTGRFTSIVEAPNLVYNTGNQTIGGAKTFSNNLTVNGGDLFVNTSNNRVGVNTITPTATLDVNGTALFRNGLNISGTRPTVNSTGILLSGEATTQTYVTGISGSLQTQITTLNNQTGSYYPRTNPSGYITGVDLSFSGNYYTKDESESRYVNTTGAETILGDKTFHDKVYINNLYVTGLETIINTTNTNVASNYLLLNLTGGAVDGGIFFITGSGLTGINDSGAIIGFDHSDKFKFGIATRASDLSTLDTIASYEEVTGISGGLQTQISTLNSATGSYVLNSQTGQFYANSNPSGFITGVDLSSYATQTYVTGISGELQTQITNLNNATGSYVLNSQTGDFYANSNPSGFITGIENIVFTTGDQTISGIKTFSTGVNVTGDVNINGNLIINGYSNQSIIPISNISDTTLTITPSGAGIKYRFTNTTGCAITIQPNSITQWAIGQIIYFRRTTSGGVLTWNNSGVSIQDDKILFIQQGDEFALQNIGTNNFEFI